MNAKKAILAITVGLSITGVANADSLDDGFAAFYSDIMGKSAETASPKDAPINTQQNSDNVSISKKGTLAEKVDNEVTTEADIEKLDETISEATAKGNLSGTPSSLDGLYIQNIPQTSAVHFSEKLQLLPYNSEMVFSEGRRVFNKEELPNNTAYTRCSLVFKDFGVGRNIKANQDFLITKVAASATEFALDPTKIRHEIVIKLANEHLNTVYCESTEKASPFTIGDLKYQFGGIINFKLRDFIDI